MRHSLTKPALRSQLTPDLQYTHCTTIGQNVRIRARGADGRAYHIKTPYRPTYYLPVDTHTGETSFDGRPLLPQQCESIREGREFLSEHPDAFGNIQCEYMVLSDVYGGTDIVPDMDRLYIWNIDIEVDSEVDFAPVEDPHNAVTAITVMWRHRGQRGTVMYGLQPYTPAEGAEYVLCADEQSLLRQFVRDWREDYPDIVTGWNVQFFDIPYLVGRITRELGESAAKSLSPYQYLAERKSVFYGREQTAVDIRGIATLDYLELYRKFTFTQQESYRLDHIAHVELGKRKLSYTEFQSLAGLYKGAYNRFMDYNRADVELVESIDDKMKLIELVCALAYSAKANFVDPFRQVRLWDIRIYNFLRQRHIQIPPRTGATKTEQYAGAYVKDPMIGQHDWVVSYDLVSLYPHIIRQWNLSPETLVGHRVSTLTVAALLERIDVNDYLSDGDHVPEGYALAANGVLTRRDTEGFLPAMIREMYITRHAAKDKMNTKKKELEAISRELHRRGVP